MKIYGGGNIYADRNDSGNALAHKVFAVLCILSAVVMTGVYFALEGFSSGNNSVIPEFERAMSNGDYNEALDIYRSVQDKVLSKSPEEAEKMTDENSQLKEMEHLVGLRVDDILSKIRNSRYVPSSEDAAFLGGMQELTTSLVSSWLNDLCTQFLLGKIEKPDITFVLNQMSPIGNFAATVRTMIGELDLIEKATGDVQNAERHFDDGDYITSVKTYKQVLSRNKGFVYDYSEARLAEIMEIMYDPMVERGEHLLDTFRFYSAEVLLSDLAQIFPQDARVANDLLTATSNTSETAVYKGKVEVLCVRNLIADNEIASGFGKSVYDKSLTCEEFEKMLDQLYKNNFCLVDAETLTDLSNDTYLVEKDLIVPVGKKPLIIVVETLDYNAVNYGQGFNRRLVLNDQGQVCSEYIDHNGDAVVSRTREAIGILDKFVESHHDFTYDGAKGVISIAGYEACFGYVISQDEMEDRNRALSRAGYPTVNYSAAELKSNQEAVKSIAEVLKDTGWKFASSTYGYINAKASDMRTIQLDMGKWMDQIEPLLGDTHMIVYPNGDYIYGTDPRAVWLKENGFRIFFGLGPRPYYIYGTNYLYYDRTLINAKILASSDLKRLFDVNLILDKHDNTQKK